MHTSSRTTVPSRVSEAPSMSTVAFAALNSTSAEAAVQTTESGLSPEMDEGVWRVCGEIEGVNRMWIGCEVKEYKFRRHAWCMGVTAYRDRALKSLKFYCPKHIGKINYNNQKLKFYVKLSKHLVFGFFIYIYIWLFLHQSVSYSSWLSWISFSSFMKSKRTDFFNLPPLCR